MPEYRLRAAFIYNVAKFVEWPTGAFPDASTPIVIGLVGTDAGTGSLEWALAMTTAAKTVDGRPVVVRRQKSPEETPQPHILFVGASEKDRLVEVLHPLQTTSVLTVSEIDEFTLRGGILHFDLSGNTVRFDINNGSARNAGLKISSKLLTLATFVR